MTEQDRQGLIDIFTLYEEIMTTCEDRDVAAQDALTALTLVIKDMALSHHNPLDARQKAVLALDRAFDLEETALQSAKLH